MSTFNSRFTIPGVYGDIFTEASSQRNAGAAAVGVVGPAHGGAMEEILTYTSPEVALRELGSCQLMDYMLTTWANGAGTIKVVRVGATRTFNELWQDSASATDYTDELSDAFDNATLFPTAGSNSYWFYVGKEETFDSVYFKILSAASIGTGVALEAEYYNGTSWATLVITDGTTGSSKTLQSSGYVTFVAPNDWVETAPTLGGSPDTGTYFWVRFRTAVAPTTAPVMSLVVESYNALPATGSINEDYYHTEVATGSISATALTCSGGDFTNATYPVEVGDIVYNVTDGSTATVVTVSSGTALVTSTLSGGELNLYIPAATGTDVVAANLDDLTYATATDSINVTTGSIVITSASFITDKVRPGDYLAKLAGAAEANSDLRVQITSVVGETEVTVAVGLDLTAFEAAVGNGDTLYICSKTSLKLSAATHFPYLRVGQVLTIGEDAGSGTGTCEIVQVIDSTHAICSTITGTALYFTADTLVSYARAADTVRVYAPVEKAYLKAKDWGTSGNDISFRVYTDGQYKRVLIWNEAGVEEEFSVLTTDSAPLTTVLADINTNSILVEGVAAGVATDLPDSSVDGQLSGGANGTATAADYLIGLQKFLADEEVRYLYCMEQSDAVNAGVLAHVGTAESLDFQIPRIGFVAKPETENFLKVTTAVLADPSAYSFKGRVQFVNQRATIASLVTTSGTRSDRTAFVAALAGMTASLPSASPQSGKNLNVIGIDKIFNRSEQKQLINAGVCVANQDANGIAIVRGITPTLNSPYYELSVRRAVDDTDLDVRDKLRSQYITVTNENGILDSIKATVEGVLQRKLAVPGFGGTLRDWRNVQVSFNNIDYTRVDVSYEVIPLGPINFIFTSMFVHSGIEF